MDRHARIDVFSAAAHRMAVQRLRDEPRRVQEALDVLARWRRQSGGTSHGDPYWREWEALLRNGVDDVERVACAATDHAATLRSMSPLGRFITLAERAALLKQTRDST